MTGLKEKRGMSIVDRLRGLMGLGPRERPEVVMPEMISCEEALTALYEYLDGELTGVAHDRVKAHLDACARCFPKLRVEESFRLTVRRTTRGEKPSLSLRDNLLSALARAAEEDGRD
jgi:mycothiol system anti-sigma-R factor